MLAQPPDISIANVIYPILYAGGELGEADLPGAVTGPARHSRHENLTTLGALIHQWNG